jgi:hypothetical protein
MKRETVRCITPCDTCPFRKTSLLGVWQAAHLVMTYVFSSYASLQPKKMGCHKYNGMIKPRLSAATSPPCGGWVRAAWGSPMVRFLEIAHDMRYPNDFDPNDHADELWTVEELLQKNGIRMDKMPPLQWSPDCGMTLEEWNEKMSLFASMVHMPEVIDATLVVEGSPLDRGVTTEQIETFFGIKL